MKKVWREREVELRTVAVRSRRGEDLGVLSIDEFALLLNKEIAARTIN